MENIGKTINFMGRKVIVMELLESGSICRKHLQVSYFDCDLNNKVKLSAILRQVQQISMEHCDLLGIGEKFMEKLNMAFLLGKLSVKIIKMPSATEKLVITTIPDCKPMRAQYKRATTISNIDGEKLIEVDARWILVDMSSKKIVRNKPEQLVFPEHQHETFMHDIKMPKKGELLGKSETVVSYSHLDVNHHMNNTFYADMACNAICNAVENSPILTKEPSSLIINYKNQAVRGNVVTSSVYNCTHNKDTYVVWGTVEDQNCYSAAIAFKE